MLDKKDFHPEILPPEQQKIWSNLKPAASLGFTLYGGTAIALRLGHRTSVDFDFFSSEKLDSKKKTELLQSMPFLKKAELIGTDIENNTLNYMTSDGVKLSFFGGLNLGRVGKPDYTPDGVLLLASLDDLMATKMAVIMQRIELKDYQDIAAMCRAGQKIEKGLGSAQTIFSASDFSPMYSLKTMVWFDSDQLKNMSIEDKKTILKAANEVDLNSIPKVELVSNNLCES